jgi:hypothetical protein
MLELRIAALPLLWDNCLRIKSMEMDIGTHERWVPVPGLVVLYWLMGVES